MGYWKSKPNNYKERNFIEIPAGAHRAKICQVSVEKFKYHKKCYEITLAVSGYHGKLWYYLWDNPDYGVQSCKRFANFYESFQINDRDPSKYKSWIGHYGAVYVSHNNKTEEDLFDYVYAAEVTSCLSGRQRDKLPEWREGHSGPYKESYMNPNNELPF